MLVILSMEMMLPEFSEPMRGANFRGGLGILAGEIMAGLKKSNIDGIAIIPLYSRYWLNRQPVSYDSTPARLILELRPQINDRRFVVKVWEINRGGSRIYGIECPEVFDVLYTNDRWQRLRQEVLIGKTAPLLLKKLGTKPDILWLNESHTVVAVPTIRDDPYFQGTKILFTIHTPDPAGLEKFYEGWFDELAINREKYYSVFVRDGMIDFARAAMSLADAVNAVSQEHCQVTKEMFSEFSHKIIGIRNGSDRDLWLSPRLKEAESLEELTLQELWEIQQADKKDLLYFIKEKTGVTLSLDKPLMAWARRIVAYKNQYPMLEPIIRAICAERGEVLDTSFGRLAGLGFQVFGAGRACEDDHYCLGWVEGFYRWMQEEQLRGKFVFLADYNFELIQKSAAGPDNWLHCPREKWEACGTSGMRANTNGVVELATKTGGETEYIHEFNLKTGQGNGFFIEPYHPLTVYQKLAIISQLYYNWLEKGDPAWLQVKMNAFQTGKTLDITLMIEEYRRKLFEPLVNPVRNLR